MEALVSVIIPVYNAASFIERCLGSVRAQTYSGWEAICVDDGSTDGSVSLLRTLASEDGRIKVISKENEGVSVARNVGVKAAQGDFICFLDSDDFLHPQTFEICLSFISKENPDLVCYTYNKKYRTSTLIKNLLGLPEKKYVSYPKYTVGKIEYRLTEDIFHFATEYSRPDLPSSERRWAVKHCQPWRCLYRRGVVEGISFIPGIIYEDFPWWGEVLLNVKKAVILNLPLYYYYPNKKSFIMAADQEFRIQSLKKAIAYSEACYTERGTSYQREMWFKNFITPFMAKLTSKIKRFGDDSKNLTET